eukprot:CAMPEP_0181273312 /NCGR_PEP_ID=MMETSP1097-20121128/8551_1 /TAXON_ID=35684 /ORGANISM="Pseudopedinella elastica, Strain CCMP716" /LENGTH=32 /DNA_ID= /DNA_START= /DNA_END= /DNA_ORIENTATION=
MIARSNFPKRFASTTRGNSSSRAYALAAEATM